MTCQHKSQRFLITRLIPCALVMFGALLVGDFCELRAGLTQQPEQDSPRQQAPQESPEQPSGEQKQPSAEPEAPTIEDRFAPPKVRQTRPPEKPAQNPKAVTPVPARKPAITRTSKKNIAAIEKRIKEMEAVTRETVKTVSGAKAAEKRLNVLKNRARRLRHQLDRSSVMVTGAVKENTERLRKKWEPLTTAMRDQKDRTNKEWNQIAEQVLFGKKTEPAPDKPAKPESPATTVPESAIPETGADTNSENKPDTKPLEPVKAPDPSSAMEEFAELKDAVSKQKKPARLSASRWAELMDEFEKDNATLQAGTAALIKKWKENRNKQLDPLVEALRSAGSAFADLDSDPSDDALRDLAWRLHQVDLAGLRRRHADVSGLARELDGEAGDLVRELIVASSTGEYIDLRFTRSLDLIGRLMDTNTAAPAPVAEDFNDINEDGLRSSYPGEVRPGSLHRQVVRIREAAARRLHRSIADLDKQIVNAGDIVDRKDQEEVDLLLDDLRFEQRMGRGADHPLSDAERRVATKEKQIEQRKTRDIRIEEFKTGAQTRIERLKKLLAANLGSEPDKKNDE